MGKSAWWQRVTGRSIIVLILAGWQGIRFLSALQYARVLREYAPFPGPVYIALSGLGWALALGLAAWGLLNPASRWQLPFWKTLWFYLGWFWFDRLFLQHHTPVGGSNRFALLLLQSLVLLYFRIEEVLDKRKEYHERKRKPEN